MHRVREQTDADVDAVAALHVRAWRVGYAGIFPADVLDSLDPAEFAARRRANARHPHFRTLLAVDDDGRILGFATFGPYSRNRRVDDLDHTVGELNALYVDPVHWRAGVGRALMAATRAELAVRGLTEMRLWVAEDNARARRFYERCGLSADGQRGTHRLPGPPGAEPATITEIRYRGATAP